MKKVFIKKKSTVMVFSQLDAHCVYLKLGLIDPAFKRRRRLIGARGLSMG